MIVDTVEVGGGYWWKEGEVTSQKTCMNDPWTWATLWGLTEEAGSRLGGRGQRGKNCNSCNRIKVKKKKKKEKRSE